MPCREQLLLRLAEQRPAVAEIHFRLQQFDGSPLPPVEVAAVHPGLEVAQVVELPPDPFQVVEVVGHPVAYFQQGAVVGV